MKRIALVALCAFFLIGCAGMTVNTSNGKSQEYTLAYDAGIVAATLEPAYAKTAVTYGSGLLALAQNGTISQDVLNTALSALDDKFGAKPEYKAAIAVLLAQFGGTVTVKTGTIDPKLVDVISGFLDGMKAITG